VVVLHVLQMTLLTDQQVQVLLPVCVHSLHVRLPGKGVAGHCWPGAWDMEGRTGAIPAWGRGQGKDAGGILPGCSSRGGSQLLLRVGGQRGHVEESRRFGMCRLCNAQGQSGALKKIYTRWG
jgi:hypothetical protein